MSKTNLRNYTSVVPAAKSQASIEQLLVQAGATTISKFYDESQRCEGFFFQLKVGPHLLVFKLPANAELVFQLFVRRAVRLDARKRAQLRAQAERTAWRTLFEWVQMQLDMIALKQVDILQVLLPYQYDQATSSTLYERVVKSNLNLLN
jgi:hypothetical protein